MDQKYNSESQTVRWSTIVLCTSLLLVYVVLYYVKGDIFKGNLDKNVENTGGLIVSEISNDIDYSMKNNSGDESKVSVLNTGVENKVETSSPNISEYNAGETPHSTLSEMIVLPGTHSFYGSLDFVDLLGISYKYALKDDKGIYYLNMDDYPYDFSDIARKLGGNLYIMNTESEILANKLFGDKITYINVPEYANRRVLMLVNVKGHTWLIALDINIYHQSKSYLQSLFI